MATRYYRPRRKWDLIGHLIADHRAEHVVTRPDGTQRIATAAELDRLYANGWTLAVLTERHDDMHKDREG